MSKLSMKQSFTMTYVLCDLLNAAAETAILVDKKPLSKNLRLFRRELLIEMVTEHNLLK